MRSPAFPHSVSVRVDALIVLVGGHSYVLGIVNIDRGPFKSLEVSFELIIFPIASNHLPF